MDETDEPHRPGQPSRRPRRILVSLVALAVVAAAAIAVAAITQRDHGSEVIAVEGTQPAPQRTQGQPAGNSETVIITSTMDPLDWVLHACLVEHGLTPPVGPSDPAQVAAASRACSDFLAPVNVPPQYERYYQCLRDHGLDIDPRFAVVAPADVVKRAVDACRSSRPSTVPAEAQVYQDCLEAHGQFTLIPIVIDDATSRAAADACRDLAPRAKYPPGLEPYATCLSEHGLDVMRSFAPGSSPPENDPSVVTRAAQACRSSRPPTGATSGAPSSYGDYLNCMEDHGVLPTFPIRVAADVSRAANEACRGLLPKPPVSPELAKYSSCLRDNGLDVSSDATAAPPQADPATVTKAAQACRSLRPGTNAAPETYKAYEHCLEDHGYAPWAQVRVANEVAQAAQQACKSLLPAPPISSARQAWLDCLNSNGLRVDPDKKPDYDIARKALTACASLYPKDEGGD